MIEGDPTLDFLEQNPKLKSIADFKNLYKNNKPEVASKLLWSFYFITCINDEDNPHRGYASIDKRIESVMSGYYPELDYDKYVYLYDTFQIFVLSKEERLFNIQLKKIEEVSLYHDKIDISEGGNNMDEFIKVSKALPSIWKGFDEIRSKVIDAGKQNSTSLGNAELSATDKRRQKALSKKNKA